MEAGITFGGVGVTIRSKQDGIEFLDGEAAKTWLSDPRQTADGRTIGEMNRALLHERLDQWIEKVSQ